jgi:hypothetical protein
LEHAGDVVVGHEEQDAPPAVAEVPLDVGPEVAVDEVQQVVHAVEP